MNQAAADFVLWCQLNRLTLNISKTKFMCFGNKRVITNDYSLHINTNSIEQVREFKYLALLLDYNLSFCRHIKMLKCKIPAHMATWKKVSSTINRKEALQLYKSCIMSYIDQDDVFYSCATKNLLKSFQTIKNKVSLQFNK